MIALLEFYLRKVPGSPLLPAIVPPLLRALSRASRSPDDKTLAERLKARRLNPKPCRVRQDPSGAAQGAVPEP